MGRETSMSRGSAERVFARASRGIASVSQSTCAMVLCDGLVGLLK